MILSLVCELWTFNVQYYYVLFTSDYAPYGFFDLQIFNVVEENRLKRSSTWKQLSCYLALGIGPGNTSSKPVLQKSVLLKHPNILASGSQSYVYLRRFSLKHFSGYKNSSSTTKKSWRTFLLKELAIFPPKRRYV